MQPELFVQLTDLQIEVLRALGRLGNCSSNSRLAVMKASRAAPYEWLSLGASHEAVTFVRTEQASQRIS